MAVLRERTRFIIFSLPRSGSTTLTHLLECHRHVNCLIEPFHHGNYGGKFHAAARDEKSLDATMEVIWSRWNGIKHVWHAGGGPFVSNHDLNRRLLLSPGTKVLFLVRRNLLRRFVSNYLCRQVNFWIGDKAEFYSRLNSIQIKAVDPDEVQAAIKRDSAEVKECWSFIVNNNIPTLRLYYEDLFRVSATENDRFEMVNSILKFLGFDCIDMEDFLTNWQQCFDPSVNQWADTDLYHRIPEIERIEREVGSNDTGWLFRESILSPP